MSIASHVDVLRISSHVPVREDCVTSQKNVCVRSMMPDAMRYLLKECRVDVNNGGRNQRPC